jgi:hypothetical protein
MTRVVLTVGASAPPVSASVLLTALAPYQGGPLASSVGWCVDSDDDELANVVVPLPYC